MKRVVLSVAVVVAGAVALSAGTAGAGDSTTCGAPYPPFAPELLAGGHVRGDLVVPPGTICVLVGTHVKGDAIVRPHAGLITEDATIGGDVECDRCLFLDVVKGTRLRGNLEVAGLLDGLFVHDSRVRGDIEVERSQAGGFGFEFLRNKIGGNLELERNTGRTQIDDNHVHGDVELSRNVVGPFTIERNQVGGDLECRRNDPPPTGSGNRADDKEGQCRWL